MQLHEEILQILLIGVANGSIIALIALGYTLVYGIIELINFAHGDVFMIGTMLALTMVTWVPTLLGKRRPTELDSLQTALLLVGAILASMLVCGLLNAIIERVA